MNTTATAGTPGKSDTEKYLDAFRNLFLIPRTIADAGSNRGTYRNHMLRKAKECQHMDEAFWHEASLAMIHASIATCELSEGIQGFNNIVELGEWEADELDSDITEAHLDLNYIISAWIHQAPHKDHLKTVCAAAAQTNPPHSNCRNTSDGKHTWLTCEDGIERQAPCHNCPIAVPLRMHGHDAEDLEESFEPDTPPHRESYLAEILKPARQRRHPLDHALAAVTAIARLDAATANTDPRHHEHLALAATYAVQAIRHLSNLPHKEHTDFPIREYAPYGDALAAAVFNNADPDAADARHIPAPEQRGPISHTLIEQ